MQQKCRQKTQRQKQPQSAFVWMSQLQFQDGIEKIVIFAGFSLSSAEIIAGLLQ